MFLLVYDTPQVLPGAFETLQAAHSICGVLSIRAEALSEPLLITLSPAFRNMGRAISGSSFLQLFRDSKIQKLLPDVSVAEIAVPLDRYVDIGRDFQLNLLDKQLPSEPSDSFIFFPNVLYGCQSTSFWLGTGLIELVVAWILLFESPDFWIVLRLALTSVPAVLGGALALALTTNFREFWLIATTFFCSFPWLTGALQQRSLPLHCCLISSVVLAIATLTRSPASFLPMLWVACPLFSLIIVKILKSPFSYIFHFALGFALPLGVTLSSLRTGLALATDDISNYLRLSFVAWLGIIGMLPIVKAIVF